MKTITPIWTPADFDQAVADAIALTKPEPELAPVVDIRTKERVQ